MSEYQNYKRKVFILQQTLQWNLNTDYQGEFTPQNQQNIMSLFLRVFEIQNPQQREEFYQLLKSKITDQNQLRILQWFENQRGQKYFGEKLPHCNLIKAYRTIPICPNPDFLEPTRIIGLSKNVPVQQKAPLDTIAISESLFMLQSQPSTKKTFLYRRVRQRPSKPTPWVVQMTKDHRYVWKACNAIDRNDVFILLNFILTKRSQNDYCPSILINTGSHGDTSGKTGSDTGDFNYTAQFIHDETLNSLYEMIQKDGHHLRVNKNNIKLKVCIHFLSSVSACVYPERADHIIDTQCFGAYMPVKGQNLHLANSFFIEKDLNFLYNPDNKNNNKKKQEIVTPTKIQQPVYPPKQSIWEIMRKTIITEPMIKLIEDSVIITNDFDAYKLVNLFRFKAKIGFFQSVPKIKKIKDLKLLFRASEHHFNIAEYFNLYGQEKDTFFLCITEKDKIIGAYSPFSHKYKSSPFSFFDKVGQWVEDKQRESFIFSVTNNEKFFLKTPQRAIFRMKDKSLVVFGGKDFSICDKANKVKESVTNINYSYFNPNYQKAIYGEFNSESCLRFNGDDGYYFLIKQWEVWKVQFEYVNFGISEN